MRLYFLRHAQAEPGGGMDDHNRQLTADGHRRTATAAKVMTALGIAPAHIYSSPRIRSLQTAEIVADALDMPVEVRAEVNFGFDLVGLDRLIENLSDDSEVMFVGHEPSLSMMVHELTGADIDMKKGGLARVDLYDLEDLSGTLVWLIAPRVFDALGG
jgi:phosphohistidine phosphatase